MMRGYTESENRRAENRILRDIANAEAAGIRGGQGRDPAEVYGGGSVGVVFIVGFVLIVLAVLVFGGCGAVAGFGDDLRQWSSGIRGSVQSGPMSEPGR